MTANNNIVNPANNLSGAPYSINIAEFRDVVTAPAVHISAGGNAKTGKCPTFNLLPGGGLHRFSNGKYAVNVPGSCAGVCDACERSCYAVRSLRYPAAVRAWAANTWAAMEEPASVRAAIVEYCKEHKPAVFRIHSSGEFCTYRYFCEVVAAAALCPETVFYGYTKKTLYLEKYETERGPLPENLILRASMWNGSVANPTGAPAFHYDDGTDADAASLPHCPAVMRDGSARVKKSGERFTCADCNYKCARARYDMAVYAH